MLRRKPTRSIYNSFLECIRGEVGSQPATGETWLQQLSEIASRVGADTPDGMKATALIREIRFLPEPC